MLHLHLAHVSLGQLNLRGMLTGLFSSWKQKGWDSQPRPQGFESCALTRRLLPAEQDLNFRPSGYEADDQPDCPTS